MKTKAEVTEKIKRLCDKHGVGYPDFNDRKSLEDCAKDINSRCPLCSKRKHGGGAVICSCEIKTNEDYLN